MDCGITVERCRNALSREPESMSVGDLNQAVKDLRELLYQKQIEFQKVSKELLDTADNEGCTDDLTVVSTAALDKLKAYIP